MTSSTNSDETNGDMAVLVDTSGNEGEIVSLSSSLTSTATGTTPARGGNADKGSAASTDTEGEDGNRSGAESSALGSRRGSQLSLSVSGEEEWEAGGEQEPMTEQQILGSSETRQRAISQLVMYSCILLVVPLALMFITYHFVFIGTYHLDHSKAITYAGIVAAVAVYLILALFAWNAYRDERKLAQQVEALPTAAKEDEQKKTD